MAGKKKKSKKSSARKASHSAAPAHKSSGKKRRSSGGKKRRSSGGGKKRGAGFMGALRSFFGGKGKGGKKRRSSGGKRRSGGGRHSRSSGGGMSLKQFAMNGLKLGLLATAGWVAGEMLRSYLLKPKADGSASTLASFEQRHLASPVVSAAITAIPGVVGGIAAYWAGGKFHQPILRNMVAPALLVGGVVSGGGRIILANRYVAEKTDGLQLVKGASPGLPGNQLMAPAAPAAAQPSAGYGDAFVGNPYGYTQPPAWKQLGDTFAPNPYGDTFVGNPGGDYLDRTNQRPRQTAGYGTTAAQELDG